jgi:hypothetical protein
LTFLIIAISILAFYSIPNEQLSGIATHRAYNKD